MSGKPGKNVTADLARAITESQSKKDVILIVDDEPSNRLLLKEILTSNGYEVRMARRGSEALKMVQEDPPSAVILDVLLPDMNGMQICRKMKSTEQTRFIPIVLLTALRGNQERIQGIEAGADDFISKPVHRVELLTRIKSLVRIKHLNEILEQKVAELESVREKLKTLAVTDGLTGVYNYRAFRRQLKHEISRSRRFRMPVSLLIIDIDHFKEYNDRFGHLNGDRALQQFASLLKKDIREIDCLARYGGEEFTVILPGTDKESSAFVAEKLRVLVEETDFSLMDSTESSRITVSIGAATYPDDADNEETLIHLTDQALYKAKRTGRNRFVIV